MQRAEAVGAHGAIFCGAGGAPLTLLAIPRAFQSRTADTKRANDGLANGAPRRRVDETRAGRYVGAKRVSGEDRGT
ncbi:hypothetical protein FGB62_11g336 [Gracilaria domingensis]|nr:hypothetical protein FGB62_11g336 [Gracilaria domingensis]